MPAVKRYLSIESAAAALESAAGWPHAQIVALCDMDIDRDGAHIPDEYGNRCYAPDICDGYALRMVKGRVTQVDSMGYPTSWIDSEHELEDGRVGRPG